MQSQLAYAKASENPMIASRASPTSFPRAGTASSPSISARSRAAVSTRPSAARWTAQWRKENDGTAACLYSRSDALAHAAGQGHQRTDGRLDRQYAESWDEARQGKRNLPGKPKASR